VPLATAKAVLTALSLFPDLGPQGFTRQPPERIPAPGGIDIMFAAYEHSAAPRMAARAEIRVYTAIDAAKQDYALQADGWKNPPPELFGGQVKNADHTALTGLEEARAYRTTSVDKDGNRIWTDVYRFGRVVVISHVLGREDKDADPIRRAIAESVGARAR
jgi:hypothetical protein